MTSKAFDYTAIKRQSVKNGIVRCPKCGKMSKRGNTWKGSDKINRRMYYHNGVIESGFPKITVYCMVEEATS